MLSLLLALAQPVDFESARLIHGAKRTANGIEFTQSLQVAEIEFSKKLDGVEAVTVGAWVFPKQIGEQYFFCRGLPEAGPNGERMFRPNDAWVNFLLGTDSRGFLMGTIHGNGQMPFPYVTLNEVPIDSWSQLVVVKDAKGFQKFYRNGTLVCTDLDSCHAGKVRPFKDK